jgi:hypothetical protein
VTQGMIWCIFSFVAGKMAFLWKQNLTSATLFLMCVSFFRETCRASTQIGKISFGKFWPEFLQDKLPIFRKDLWDGIN